MIELQTVTTKAKNPSTNEFQDVTWGGINVLSTSGTADYNNLTNKPTINGVTVQGSLTTGDLLITAADVGALPSGTKYGADFALTIDSQTFIVTAQLKDQDGNNLGQAKTIDLPLETMVVGGRYDDTTQKVILTLKNGQTVEFSVADLVNGLQSEITLNNKLDADLIDDVSSENKFVTAAEKAAWNKSVSYMFIPNNGDLNDYYGAENAGNYLCTDANVSTLSHKPSAITTAFRMDVIFYNDQTIQVIYPNDEKCISFLRIYKNNTWSEWKESAIEMTILSYGNSTWDDFMKAYLLNSIVYCRAGSSTPQTSPQLRLAFMAYVNNEVDPTEVEFQYYRSVNNKSDSVQGDEVYVYRLSKTNGWSNLKRNAYSKVAVAAPITKSYASGTVTIGHANSGVTAGTYDSVTVDAQGHVTAGSNQPSIIVDDELSTTSVNPVQNKVITEALDDKVNTEEGKGLSTNDYTIAEKTKLAGIAEGAEVNIQSDWNQTDNSKDDYIKNKPTIPTTASEISYDNTISHLEATNTQAAIDELAAITYPSINITADSGAIITATNGAITLTATMEQTSLKMLIPSYGKWTFSASLNGKVISKIINFTASKIYDVEFTFVNVYGVEWGLTGQTLSRTGAAAEFTNPIPYVNNGMSAEDCSSPFDNLYPWNGMVRETVDGNEVVKIPKFWYKIEKTNSKLSIQIADAPRTGFNVSPAHRARGSYPEQDYVYIGRYHSDSNYKSTSGVIPIAKITRETARTNQAAIGSGYYQLDFSLWITIWMLYLVEFANWNTQSMIGYNCGNNNSRENTGSTDTMPYHTGTMQASKTTYGVGVQYRYIEDPWGNVSDWCDGITFGPDENNNAGEGIYCFEDFENYSDSYSASGAVLVGRRAHVTNYIQDFNQSNVSGFDWVLYPGDIASSQNQVSDMYSFDAKGVVLRVGGSYNQSANDGLFCLTGNSKASSQYVGVGVRLQKIPSTN